MECVIWWVKERWFRFLLSICTWWQCRRQSFRPCGSKHFRASLKRVGYVLRHSVAEHRCLQVVGEWPDEVVKSYEAMILKASGGTRPQDQRPITVLDVIYRIWAEGVVLTWTPGLHGAYLGSAAMGFRAQSGTLHLAQLLQDLILLQQRRGQELWLVYFDLKNVFRRCRGLFGVLGG